MTLWRDPFACLRERGWREISAGDYAALYQRYGGSVITQPEFIQQVSCLVDLPLRFLGSEQGGEWVGGIPVWGAHLAGAKAALKRGGRRELVDLGNPEVILPLSPAHHFSLRHGGQFIAEQHAGQVAGLKPQKEQLALARPHADYSRKFRYNQRRELRLLQEAGGELRAVRDFSPQQIAGWYLELFERRWGFKPRAHAHMPAQIAALWPFMVGQLAWLEGRPIAIQLLFMAESPGWVSVEYLNGGVDPEQRGFSPGSVLSFVNTQWAEEYATAQGKRLRYSFGRSDAEYKALWCHSVPVLCR